MYWELTAQMTKKKMAERWRIGRRFRLLHHCVSALKETPFTFIALVKNAVERLYIIKLRKGIFYPLKLLQEENGELIRINSLFRSLA